MKNTEEKDIKDIKTFTQVIFMLLRIYDIYFLIPLWFPSLLQLYIKLSQPEEKQKNFKGSDELI